MGITDFPSHSQCVCVLHKQQQDKEGTWNIRYKWHKDIEDVAYRAQKEAVVFILRQE